MLEIAWNAKKTWKIHTKIKQHSINIKNYTAHPHDLVHVPATFRENTAMRFWVTVRKLNVTDGRTDRQTDGVAISPVPGPTAPAGDNNGILLFHKLNILSPLCHPQNMIKSAPCEYIHAEHTLNLVHIYSNLAQTNHTTNNKITLIIHCIHCQQVKYWNVPANTNCKIYWQIQINQ